MPFQPRILLYLLAASVSSVATQSLNCSEPIFSLANATGNASFSGLHPNGSVPGFQAATWTIHTGIEDVVVASDNTSFMLQKWWLSTNPVITTPADDFPFAGCVFLLAGIQTTSEISQTAKDSNTCQNILGDACQSAILNIINSNITASSNSQDEHLCDNIIRDLDPPSECTDSSWTSVRGTRK